MKARLTRVETLIVTGVAVCAILIVWPLTSRARDDGRAAVCMANTKALTQAWLDYATDHVSYLCGGNTYNDEQWIGPPRSETGQIITSNIPVSYEQEVRGYVAGTLWPYVENTRPFHCPADNKWKSLGRGYRSTSIQGMMNGECHPGSPGYARKLSDIAVPGRKYVFIENVDARGWNMGSWIMNQASSSAPSLIDPVAAFHAGGSTLGFADGHVEEHMWRSARLIEWARLATDDPTRFPGFRFVPNPSDERELEDVSWLAAGYIPKRY